MTLNLVSLNIYNEIPNRGGRVPPVLYFVWCSVLVLSVNLAFLADYTCCWADAIARWSASCSMLLSNGHLVFFGRFFSPNKQKTTCYSRAALPALVEGCPSIEILDFTAVLL